MALLGVTKIGNVSRVHARTRVSKIFWFFKGLTFQRPPCSSMPIPGAALLLGFGRIGIAGLRRKAA